VTPNDLAALHARAFAPERGWTADEFEDLIASPHVRLLTRPGGMLLVRTVAGEAEILTLAVAPDHRRRGIADALLRDWLSTTDAEEAFLEVAADNAAAQHLYQKHGFARAGLRKGYYARPHGGPVDAVLMKAALTHRNSAKSLPNRPKTG
jgi:ribosomal-protein-alanine N-acetyltransferase